MQEKTCILGYSDFYNLMGFTSKQMPNNIIKNVCEKSFLNGLIHFLRICVILAELIRVLNMSYPQGKVCICTVGWASVRGVDQSSYHVACAGKGVHLYYVSGEVYAE